MSAITKVRNLIEGRMTGATREVPVPSFVIKHIDEVMENFASEALRKFPRAADGRDTDEARYGRVAVYLDAFLEGVADNLRPHATKQFIQVMACYIRNDAASYSIDSSGCVNPIAAA